MNSWQKRLAMMTPENRRIWDLARRAVNEMGFACQMAAQGAVGSQVKREDASQKAMDELFEILAPAISTSHLVKIAPEGTKEQRNAMGRIIANEIGMLPDLSHSYTAKMWEALISWQLRVPMSVDSQPYHVTGACVFGQDEE